MAEDANTSDLGREAERARAEAEAADAVGRAKNRGRAPAMTHAQRALRDTAIITALHAGDQVKDVARAFAITPRSVRRVYEGYALRSTALDRRPMEIVERVLRAYEMQMRDFAAMADECRERTPAVAIAAMKGLADALERYVQLLSDVGKLPSNLELFRSEMEMRRVGELMVDKIDELERGEVSATEVAEFFAALLRPTTPLWDAEGEADESPELGPG